MADLGLEQMVQNMVAEINQTAEKDRRTRSLERYRVYQYGGTDFLIERLEREFDVDTVRELRLAPINFFGKIVDKKATLYKRAPIREPKIPNENDSALISFYEDELDVNELGAKANRYYHVDANVVFYTFPRGNDLRLVVVPAYLYSVNSAPIDQTQAMAWAFSDFSEEGEILSGGDAQDPATGRQRFSRDRRHAPTKGNAIDSDEFQSDRTRQIIMWSDNFHVTTTNKGKPIVDPTKDGEQFINPIGVAPVVNIAKERDNTFWSRIGENNVDLNYQLQLGWSDLLSTIKHQAFGILTIISEESPRPIKVGPTKAVWLKAAKDQTRPELKFINSNAPISEQKDALMELLALYLSQNNLNPGDISGMAPKASSGFQALIENSDALEARKMDIAPFTRAEKELWDHIKRWHNWMFDNGLLSEEAKALGKFSEEFELQIEFADVKPLESDKERLDVIKQLLELRLVTRKDALKKFAPQLSEDEINQKLEVIEQENRETIDRMRQMVVQQTQSEESQQNGEES